MDRELIERTLTYIRDHPEEHNQAMWVGYNSLCGTTCCFAGHALLLSGYRLRNHRFVRPDGVPVPEVGDEAAALLGLGPDQSTYLFSGVTNFDEVEQIAKAILNGESAREAHTRAIEGRWSEE